MTPAIPRSADTIETSPAATPAHGGRGYVVAVGVVALASGLSAALFQRFDHRNLAMVYLLGVAFVATRFGRGPSVLASLLSVASFEYFFMPPYFEWSPEDPQYVFTFAVLLVVALLISGLASQARERALLAAQAQRAEVEVERERLRSALLSSVSHDLRTPLAVILGAASSLIGEHGLSAEERDDLGTTIYEESDRLNRLLGNLLDMTRVQSGDLKVTKEPYALEETVGSAVRRLRHVLKDHVVQPALATDLPLVPLDALLMEQVLVNLLENAARYTPKGSRIDVRAGVDGSWVAVDVSDAGPGLPSLHAGSRKERFDRTANGGGLGLAICHAIVVAHGGRMWAANRPEGGATVRILLPLSMDAPPLSPPPEEAHGRR
jgi:two-component system sensor histidine kinase KdpD